MIHSLRRPSSFLRRAIAILVAVVLALLLLAPSANACASAHVREAPAPAAMDHGAMDGMPDCTEPAEPAPADTGCNGAGGPACPASHGGGCALMTGCAAVVFVVHEAPVLVPTSADRGQSVVAQHALTHATAPELPPPRA